MKRLFNKGTTVFEDIDEGYYENRVYHIPNKCRWILVWLTKQNYVQNTYARANDDDPVFISNRPLGGASSADGYSHAPQILYKAMRFLWALGYQAYKTSISGNCAVGVFAGLSEQARAGYTLSPSYGLLIRYIDWVLTDLPLKPTKPIDAGLVEFCKTCLICAEACPVNSISLEKEPSYEVRDPGNNPGHCCWHQGWTACASGFGGPWDCCQCQAVCPFNNLPDAIIHPVVRAVAATTPIFNGFFATMERTMGYGRRKDDEDWWNRDLSTWKFDTLYGFGTAGW